MNNERKMIALLKKLMASGAGQPPPLHLGFSPTQVNILDALMISSSVTVRDLAEKLKLSTPTISVAVRKMEKDGYITKESNESDARVLNIKYTSKAASLYREIDSYRLNKVRNLLSPLTTSEQETLIALLSKALEKT